MKDYVRNPKPRAARGRGGSRSRSNSNPPVPVGKIVIALVFLAGFGGFLYHISGSSKKDDSVAQTQTNEPKPIPIEQQRPAKEQFDYMQILQNKEVPVVLPDGSVVGDPSTDPQLLEHQQNMQETLRQQQERAKQLAAEQNGKLPNVTTDVTTSQTITGINGNKNVVSATTPHAVTATTTASANRLKTEDAAKADPRKPRSFATVIATESAKKQQAVQKDQKERDQILAIFSQNQNAKPATAAASRPAATASEPAGSHRFMMQCGAFRTTEQANSLQSRINSQGQHASVRQGYSASGVWNRVMLGPYASHSAAEAALAQLKGSGTVGNCTIFSQ